MLAREVSTLKGCNGLLEFLSSIQFAFCSTVRLMGCGFHLSALWHRSSIKLLKLIFVPPDHRSSHCSYVTTSLPDARHKMQQDRFAFDSYGNLVLL
jgi:hypothetical protein